MHKWLRFVPPLAVALAGCAHYSGDGSATQTSSRPSLIVTPETALTGSVVSVNTTGRFAVLNFPVGRMPPTDHSFNVYRNGLKVGEVKVTGPQRDDNIVADILQGEAQAGDEVRDR